MNSSSLDQMLPAINQFTVSVRRAYGAQGLILLLLCLLAAVGSFGVFLGSDFVVATAIACMILLVFVFYLFHLYVKESTVRHALAAKEQIATLMAAESLDPGEQGELYARCALSVRSLPFHLIKAPSWLSFLITPCNLLIGYVAWLPFHTLAEVLFLSAINQHINRIKTAPTNLQYHACLANCYVMLANHYGEPISTKPLMAWPGILLTAHTRSLLETKGRASSNSAVEELSILSSFAPDQLWVHDQLAISYRELDMPDKEIEECETIIKLAPDDHQALLRLGTLYFHQGKNAKGLEIYERLKPIQPLLADELIGSYGAYKPLLETISLAS